MLVIDVEIDNGNGNDDIVARRLVIINELQCISKSQVTKIAQKIKIRWCVEGDDNNEPVKVKGEFFYHFSNIFRKPSDDRVEIDMNFPNTLSVDQKTDLESMVTIEEVKRAVWDCGSDKAPGLDGYTFSFYCHFWSTIEKDVFAAVQYFFNHGDIPKGCNSTFITLILKILGANMVKDFRPISLIGIFYKIIAKVLTNRLVGVFGDIVNEVQSAFIANRQILDGPFIVNELFIGVKRRRNRRLSLKLILRKRMIRSDGTNWTMCLYTGIRLSFDVNLSHLFYADDAMFGGQWSDSNIGTLVHVLKCFHQASGLKINMSKSKIMGIHVNNEKVNDVAATLRYLTLKTPFVYLGTKVRDNMSRVKAWKDIVEKVSSRLSRWKLKTLSIGVSWVKWIKVLTARERGGLGVPSLYALNRGLLLKWVWRFHSQSASLWSRVIKAIHGVDGGLGRRPTTGARSCWSSIVQEVKNMRIQGIDFFDYMQHKLGKGDSTFFWEVKWFEGSALKDMFPRLFTLENVKSVTVYKKLNDSSLDYSMRRKPRGGVEEDQYTVLFDMMDSIVLTPKEDRFVWSLENSGDFSVKSIRKRIDDTRFIGGEIGIR
nr:RNA-directed DNA polymerase, eukaryota, reverse transcriptase zinc-binding domain protein [Tanacetum cinerariifolium]